MTLKKKETAPTTEKSSPCAEASCPRSKLPAAGCRCRSSRPSCAGRRPRLRPAGRWRTIWSGTAHGWTWCRLSTWAAARRWAPPPDRTNTEKCASVKSLSSFFLSFLPLCAKLIIVIFNTPAATPFPTIVNIFSHSPTFSHSESESISHAASSQCLTHKEFASVLSRWLARFKPAFTAASLFASCLVVRPWPRTPQLVSRLWGSRWSRCLCSAVPTTPTPHAAAPAARPKQQHTHTRIYYHSHNHSSCLKMHKLLHIFLCSVLSL